MKSIGVYEFNYVCIDSRASKFNIVALQGLISNHGLKISQ